MFSTADTMRAVSFGQNAACAGPVRAVFQQAMLEKL
jgi:hypothetical protein